MEELQNEKTSFIFPGQGSQFVGMGKELYEKYDEAKKIYDKASEILNVDLKELCFNSTDEILSQTKNTQIALFVTEMAMLEVLKSKGVAARYTAGLSLGEYSSLCYSGVIDFEACLKLVQKRGIYMNDYIEKGNYSMAAVIGLDGDKIEEVCSKEEDFVVPVNYNCAGQIVISGNEDAVERVTPKLLEMGARKIIKLNLKSAFHTKKLNKAKELLKQDLENIEFKEFSNNVIVYKNIDGTRYNLNDDIRNILADHIVSAVHFDKEIQNMINDGVTTFIEVGPGKTLSGFVKKTNKEVDIKHVEELI